jgi:hypothetical protein
MNKYQIVALILLLAGIAVVLNPTGISCPFAEDNSTSQVNGNCTGNCTANCGAKAICPNGATCSQNISSEENCSQLGSCPVKAASTGNGS